MTNFINQHLLDKICQYLDNDSVIDVHKAINQPINPNILKHQQTKLLKYVSSSEASVFLKCYDCHNIFNPPSSGINQGWNLSRHIESHLYFDHEDLPRFICEPCNISMFNE